MRRRFDRVAAARAERSRPDADASDYPRRNTVVIVDDEPAMRIFIGAVVRRMGLTGLEASSAAEVRQVAAEHKDALVILDVSLGQDDAINVMAALAAERFQGTIMLISGHGHNVLRCVQDIGAQMNLNVVSMLRKPFTPDALRDGIRAAGAVERRAPIR